MSRVPSRRPRPVGGMAALLVIVLGLGVVMGQDHQPTAIEPGAPTASGGQVATFALG